jgi:hypothetical protein
MSLSCVCCVLSARGLCVGLITHPEESYYMWCVTECGREALIMRRFCILGVVALCEKKCEQLAYTVTDGACSISSLSRMTKFTFQSLYNSVTLLSSL